MTTKELASRCKVADITVRKWCLKNGIKRKLGKQGVMEYELTEKDVKRFQNRRSKGRPKSDITDN
jgi:hypothetical protein